MVSEPPSRYRERVWPEWVKLSKTPNFTRNNTSTAREKLGIRYEKKVHRVFEDRFGINYIPSQWFVYSCNDRIRYCQPDGILVSPERRLITLVEIKYSHTADAFWQLENLYIPVVRKFFEKSDWRIATVEVVKWYDPAVRNPVKVVLREKLEDVKPSEYSVHILNRIS